MTHWDVEFNPVDDGRTLRALCLRDGLPIDYADAIGSWRHDAGFRAAFIATLSEAPFEAYFWETPPVTLSTLTRPFECVLVDSPALARLAPDDQAFAQQFKSAANGDGVAAFANLGGDAFLVAPCPAGPPAAYAHLAAFARNAPMAQQHTLWEEVGRAMADRVTERPLWLSTSGLGVPWLHVRLDARPKYYTHRPYRMAT